MDERAAATKYASGGIIKGSPPAGHPGPHKWGEIEHILKPSGYGQAEVGPWHVRGCTDMRCATFRTDSPCWCTDEEKAEVLRQAFSSQPHN